MEGCVATATLQGGEPRCAGCGAADRSARRRMLSGALPGSTHPRPAALRLRADQVGSALPCNRGQQRPGRAGTHTPANRAAAAPTLRAHPRLNTPAPPNCPQRAAAGAAARRHPRGPLWRHHPPRVTPRHPPRHRPQHQAVTHSIGARRCARGAGARRAAVPRCADDERLPGARGAVRAVCAPPRVVGLPRDAGVCVFCVCCVCCVGVYGVFRNVC